MVHDSGLAGQASDLLSTGIPNLDRVLGGGIPRGALVMVIGAPGTGKTMLAQQIVFTMAARGSAALYLTGYSETHEKLIAHCRGLTFFEPGLLGERVRLVSLPDLLEVGAAETEQAIIATAREQGATLVVIDGFRTMRRYLEDDLLISHFLYSLGAKLALRGATMLVTTEGEPDSPTRYPELTVCDIILGLYRRYAEGRYHRLLDVIKARGAAALDGPHPFTIDPAGITLHPRLESVAPAAEAAPVAGRAAFGVREIDALLGGGLPAGSSTVVAGSPGVGKTVLGLHFAAEGARLVEPVLVVSFRDTAEQLRQRARAFGLDLAAAEREGRVRLLELPGFGLEADRVADLLREDLERRGVRRLVLDSAAELERGIAPAERKPDFLAALVRSLREGGVATCLTLDVPKTMGQDLDLTGTPYLVLAENVLLLRDVEYLGQPHRVVAVLKMRSSGYDRAMREYELVPGRGIQLLGVAPAGAGQPTDAADRPVNPGPGAA